MSSLLCRGWGFLLLLVLAGFISHNAKAATGGRYAIVHDAFEGGGGRAEGGRYANQASFPGVAGVSQGVVSVRRVVVRAGYVGGLNETPEGIGMELAVKSVVPIAVELAGTDFESDALLFQIVSGPSNGVLSGTAPNLTYTAEASFTGTDEFTFIVG